MLFDDLSRMLERGSEREGIDLEHVDKCEFELIGEI